MTRKRSNATEELDPKEVEGYSEAQKAYYISLGYRPFRMATGHVKWLSPALHASRINGVPKKPLHKRIFMGSNAPKVFRRKHKSQIYKFMGANLLFIVIFIVVVALVVLLLKYPQLVLRGY